MSSYYIELAGRPSEKLKRAMKELSEKASRCIASVDLREKVLSFSSDCIDVRIDMSENFDKNCNLAFLSAFVSIANAAFAISTNPQKNVTFEIIEGQNEKKFILILRVFAENAKVQKSLNNISFVLKELHCK